MKKKIDLQEIDPISIAGVADENLKILEESFPCQIILRGSDITLEGKKSVIEQASETISEMMKTYSRKNQVTAGDVRSLVALISNGEHVVSLSNEPVVLHTRQEAVTPRSDGQKQFYEAVQKDDMVFAIGPAGTGKTFLAVAFAVAAYKNRRVKRIILSRPAVEAGERLGFLPGDLKEKIDPYLAPLYDALNELMPAVNLKSLLSKRTVEVIPLAYMRGRTLDNAFVILDEAQNCSAMQMKMFLTRLGPNSRAIITGDKTQMDIPDKNDSGLLQAEQILKKIDGIGFVYLDQSDVVRHRLIKDIIKAYNHNDNGK
ncbi:MAG TPA: PhoH family protein [Candidatus Marinimicrobia bacterium]|jgi:phosphate starvation-inducible PhoH-like protein|nr:PhoH family protein [Candidatus Neomarinimicrobiota bacterium]MDP7483769.1 PhoH family protein [Candidatus Neomarinimicrobiota bacterium]MDP7715936.1 PhoH family protein [Candidatus Neomarinimicrobiota bacterium]HJL83844.1 PhoH family protein [Candidatus Neomarinimicrobiota bacterium]HJM10318.1 PhoH family protein [Candidatus Neomarinimicrobiota bacterium]|tara:strand:+ start:10576 stop:11520 length:945 start_codon:yes stop_codon:yes gene_type:complete